MTFSRSFTTLSFLCALMAATGCSGAESSDGAAADQPRALREATAEELSQLRLPSNFTVVGALPTVTAASASVSSSGLVKPEDDTQGGGGGTGPYYISDYYYRGFSGRAGSYIDQIRFYGATETTGSYGGNGGNAFGEIACPNSTYLVGITGRSGSYVDALGPVCGTSTTQGIAWTTVGGSGGSAFNYRCPLNTWIIGWGVRDGSYVDQVTAFCGTSP